MFRREGEGKKERSETNLNGSNFCDLGSSSKGIGRALRAVKIFEIQLHGSTLEGKRTKNEQSDMLDLEERKEVNKARSVSSSLSLDLKETGLTFPAS